MRAYEKFSRFMKKDAPGIVYSFSLKQYYVNIEKKTQESFLFSKVVIDCQ